MKERIFLTRMVSLLTAVILMCSITVTPAFAETFLGNGDEYIQYDHIEYLPDGGKIYVYIIDGIENDFPVPPEGFNPLEASNEMLMTYGFPIRPSDESATSEWEKIMSAYKTTPVPKVQRTDITHGVCEFSNYQFSQPEFFSSRAFNATTYSRNWSGYVAKGSFAQIQGDFVQPKIDPANPSYTHESTWVGFGGYKTGKLVQTGTTMSTYAGKNSYYAWYEYLSPSHNNPEIRMNSVTIRPGDKIHTYCSFQQSNNKFNAYIANDTNGTSQSVLISISASEYFDSSTAEFVNEHPSWSATDNGLTKYGTMTWTNCQVYTMSCVWTNLASTSYDLCIMNNSSGKVLAKPSNLSGKTFKSTWYNYK